MKKLKGTKISTFITNLNEKFTENKEDILKEAGEEIKRRNKKVNVKALLLAVGMFITGRMCS